MNVELFINIDGDNVEATFVPFTARVANPDKDAVINWVITLSWNPIYKRPEGNQVRVGEFKRTDPNSPLSPYQDPNPSFSADLVQVGENEMVATVLGQPIIVAPPVKGEFYHYQYTIEVGKNLDDPDQQHIQKIDPLVVISG
jgi:hypothetical protein